ncbi:hypothetical protein PQO03_15820 [Lentisphaera profundi]|uniref:DUF5077 domain-containing protein n=1 Tax=Lentisphaera profundi TaxID=1658616 RepID=A0ABY7VZS4_9BACT|nr:hypothetical protein [Lentisphaera profundi]WDE99304.1 hypothetical protein PQO03_15820 [Lentisphaera profundi]
MKNYPYLMIFILMICDLSAQSNYLFNGSNHTQFKNHSFHFQDNLLRGTGVLESQNLHSNYQIDLLIQFHDLKDFYFNDIKVKYPQDEASSQKFFRLTMLYRHQKNEQACLTLPEQKSKSYKGSEAQFNPDFYDENRELSKASKEQIRSTLHMRFMGEVSIKKIRISPLQDFSPRTLYSISEQDEASFTEYAETLFNKHCQACHQNDFANITINGDIKKFTPKTNGHLALVKYIKQKHSEVALNNFQIQALAWYLNDQVYKRKHKKLYKNYSPEIIAKLPYSIYSISEFLQKRKIAASHNFTLDGNDAQFINKHEARIINGAIEFWNNRETRVYWDINIQQAGDLNITLNQAYIDDNGSQYKVLLDGQEILSKVQNTKSWADFKDFKIGSFYINKPGKYKLSIIPIDKPGLAVMNLKNIHLSGLASYSIDSEKTLFCAPNTNAQVYQESGVLRQAQEFEIGSELKVDEVKNAVIEDRKTENSPISEHPKVQKETKQIKPKAKIKRKFIYI